MTGTKTFGPDACPTCGQENGHAWWCDDVKAWLSDIEADRQTALSAALEEAGVPEVIA